MSTALATRNSLVVKVADRYGVDAGKMLDTLKATAFKTDKPVSNEQMMALLVVADQHKLNPFTREIFAFPDKQGGIVPVVSYDGWVRIINEHPQYDGVELEVAPDISTCTCVIHRKDRTHPTRITEYLAECRRNSPPWSSHPRRMLRNKALIQGARLAFGFAGIFDDDEAKAILAAPQQPEVIDAVPSSIITTDEVPQVVGDALDVYMRRMMTAADIDAALVVMDESRGWLTPQENDALHNAFDARWGVPANNDPEGNP